MSRAVKGRGLVLIVAALVFVVDQVTKALVLRNLAVNQSWYPIPELGRFFSVTHVTNTGAAFGLFPDRGILFVVIAVVVIVAIVAYYRYLPTDHLLVRASLGLQLGGAVGNLLDRLHYGYVVDFLDFKIWPVFNVADSSIVVGVIILAFYLLREGDDELAERASAEAGVPSEVAAPPLNSGPHDPGSSQ